MGRWSDQSDVDHYATQDWPKPAFCARCGCPFDATPGATLICDDCFKTAMRTQQQKSIDAARQKTRGAA